MQAPVEAPTGRGYEFVVLFSPSLLWRVCTPCLKLQQHCSVKYQGWRRLACVKGQILDSRRRPRVRKMSGQSAVCIVARGPFFLGWAASALSVVPSQPGGTTFPWSPGVSISWCMNKNLTSRSTVVYSSRTEPHVNRRSWIRAQKAGTCTRRRQPHHSHLDLHSPRCPRRASPSRTRRHINHSTNTNAKRFATHPLTCLAIESTAELRSQPSSLYPRIHDHLALQGSSCVLDQSDRQRA